MSHSSPSEPPPGEPSPVEPPPSERARCAGLMFHAPSDEAQPVTFAVLWAVLALALAVAATLVRLTQ
ncbi:MAG: hypothetical protein ACTHU0_36970 [Kofleriaceae bacterium]